MGQDGSCAEDINTETTNWDSDSSLNDFNWQQTTTNEVYILDGLNTQQTTIELPMWLGSNGFGSNLIQFQVDENSDPLVAVLEKDFQKEDGWELLWKKFGNPNFGVDIPSFALYNRRTGLIRAFFMVPTWQQIANANGAYIEINFDFFSTRKTAILASVDGIMQPIETFNPDNFMKVSNQITQTGFQWFPSILVHAS